MKKETKKEIREKKWRALMATFTPANLRKDFEEMGAEFVPIKKRLRTKNNCPVK